MTGVELGEGGGAEAFRAPKASASLVKSGQGVGVGFGVAAAVEQFLPLADHAHVAVVEDEDLHREAVLGEGSHLLDVHQDAGFAGDVDAEGVGVGDLDAHGGGQAVAHGAEAAGGHPAVGAVEEEVLGGPHLVLADFGADEGVAPRGAGEFVEAADGVLGLDDGAGFGGLGVGEAVDGAPEFDLFPPGGEVGAAAPVAPFGEHGLEDLGGVADDGDVDGDVLVDAAGVDVGVDLAGGGGEGVEASGDAVVEAGADVEHGVAAVHGHVGFVGAVHAEHAEEEGVGGRVGAEAHEGGGAGDAGGADELDEGGGGGGAGVDDAAAGVDDGAAGLAEEGDGFGDACRVGAGDGAVGAVGVLGGGRVGGLGDEDVLGEVDDDRAGAAAAGDVEGLVDGAGEVGAALDEVVVLGGGAGDAGGVGFLEGVVADEVGGDLAGEADDGDAVHEGVDEAGDGVGRAGSGGDEDAADAAGAAGVAFGGVDGGLFVADEDVADAVLLVERVVDGEDGTAGVAEDGVDALVAQRAEEDLGAAGGGRFGAVADGSGGGSGGHWRVLLGAFSCVS